MKSPRLLLFLTVLAMLVAGCLPPSPLAGPLADDEEPAAPAEQEVSAATPDAGPTRTERAAISAADQDVAYDPPLVIEEGGTYRGAWESNDPEVAAVTIATTEPVIIEGSHLRGRGHLVTDDVEGVDVTIRDSHAFGLNPDEEGERVGRFVELQDARNVLIEHNHVEGTAGIYFHGYEGDGSEQQTFRIVGNSVRNIDGRLSNGSGAPGAEGFYAKEGDDRVWYAQFVQFNKVRDVPGIVIAWNDVLNEPEESRVEDNISVYLSGGTAESPLRIENNFIEGAYPLEPEESDYSGGGIMLGDGKTNDPDNASAHVVATSNTVVNTTNYGIAIAAGNNLSFEDNRILSDGRLPDGTPIAAQNVGAYVWNLGGRSGSFFDNHAIDNVVGWETPVEGGRNDMWMPDVDADEGNASWSGRVTQATLDSEYGHWIQRAQDVGVTIGPR